MANAEHRFSDLREFAWAKELYLKAMAQLISDGLSGRTEQRRHGEITICYDADVVERVRRLFQDALDALQAATPRFVGQKAEQIRQFEIAKANPDFQAFMRGVSGPAPTE
jgi:hypothetical protein